jgi:tetratricopeptide (TPR) repeat protein
MKLASISGAAWFALAVVTLAALPPSAARAANSTVESELVQQGVAAYQGLEYAQAIKLLNQALQETLTLQEKRVTYMTLAFSHFALDQPDETIADFEKLLRVDPGLTLDRTVAPGARALFEKARARVATGAGGGEAVETPAMPLLSPTVNPARAREGQPVEVRLRYPGGAAQKVDLFYRTRGHKSFAEVSAPLDESGGAALSVPGPGVHAPALEYYLLALDEAGVAVAGAGSMAQPLSVEVAALKKPVYARGWFWGTIVGVLAAGAGVATIVYFTRPTITANTPGQVVFQPQ